MSMTYFANPSVNGGTRDSHALVLSPSPPLQEVYSLASVWHAKRAK